MSRKKLIYLGLLGIAVTAFLVDRLLLDHTQTAEAAPAKKQHAPTPGPRPAKSVATKAPVLDPSLSWLEKLTDVGMSHDAFSPSWLHPKQTKADEGTDEMGPTPGSPEAFETTHHLQATTVMGPGSLAVVDQHCLRVGDVLDGYKLVRVHPDKVEFKKGNEVSTLTLPTPPGSAGGLSGALPGDSNQQAGRKTTTTRPAFDWHQLLGLLGTSRNE